MVMIMGCRICGYKKPLNSNGVCISCRNYTNTCSEEYCRAVRRKRPNMSTEAGRMFIFAQKAQEIETAERNDKQRAVDIAIHRLARGDEAGAVQILRKGKAKESEYTAEMEVKV